MRINDELRLLLEQRIVYSSHLFEATVDLLSDDAHQLVSKLDNKTLIEWHDALIAYETYSPGTPRFLDTNNDRPVQ